LQIELPYQPPIAWDRLLAFIGARGARGVEHVSGRQYARTVRSGKRSGIIRVDLREAGVAPPVIALEVSASLEPVLESIIARVRQLFDLDADTSLIEAHLTATEAIQIRDDTRGLRVPGAFNGFELAVRAILGQQVTVKGASTLMSRMVIAFGDEIRTDDPLLTHLTPEPRRVAAANVAEIRAIGLPAARAASLLALATACARGELSIEPTNDVPELMRKLRAVPGIGPWTAEYIAMRAARWSDAFPVGDLALRRAAGNVSAAELLRVSEQWRPWRAYAAMHLWSKLA
jgi:AraC family transcriptional regulator of adaptative response / DNA-3-methyladenine glycosylase II